MRLSPIKNGFWTAFGVRHAREARIELLQRMPIFGGIRADILQFLLGLCPIVSVPTTEFFFRENDQADSLFVLESFGTGNFLSQTAN